MSVIPQSPSTRQPGAAREIFSPLSGRVYQVGGGAAGAVIPLKARATPGVRICYWFCGEAFLGSCTPEGSLPWQPAAGSHTLRVLDDHGRAAEAGVRVGRE